MGAAAVVSLAEVRERKQRAAFRQRLHERFDLWLDALEEKVKEPNPTLEQLTHAVWEQRQELRSRQPSRPALSFSARYQQVRRLSARAVQEERRRRAKEAVGARRPLVCSQRDHEGETQSCGRV